MTVAKFIVPLVSMYLPVKPELSRWTSAVLLKINRPADHILRNCAGIVRPHRRLKINRSAAGKRQRLIVLCVQAVMPRIRFDQG